MTILESQVMQSVSPTAKLHEVIVPLVTSILTRRTISHQDCSYPH